MSQDQIQAKIISPKHYQKGSYEPIKVISEWNLNFNLGNVIKYIARYKEKDGLNDLKKALTYLVREIEFIEVMQEDEDHIGG